MQIVKKGLVGDSRKKKAIIQRNTAFLRIISGNKVMESHEQSSKAVDVGPGFMVVEAIMAQA